MKKTHGPSTFRYLLALQNEPENCRPGEFKESWRADNATLGKFVAMAFAEGDLDPLIHRVKKQRTLTEAEYKAIHHVLEAVAAGKKWRPPHRPERPVWVKRTEAYKMLFNYLRLLNIYGVGHKEAIYRLKLHSGLGGRQIQTVLAWARADPHIMDDAAIKELSDPPAAAKLKIEPGGYPTLLGLPRGSRPRKRRSAVAKKVAKSDSA